MKLTDKHVLEGGTHVTNFDEKERAIYAEAVRQYGDPNLVISETPSRHFGAFPGGALHFLGGKTKFDLGGFWKIFRRIKESQ